MARGPGLTGDRNFQTSVEVYRKGDHTRRIVYGKTRDEVLEELSRSEPHVGWEWDYVVTERRVAMGLGPMWVKASRRYDEYGERA